MEETNEISTKDSAGGKRKTPFALAAFILGIISLVYISVFLSLDPRGCQINLLIIPFYLSPVFAVIAITCGIIALIKKQNKLFFLTGIVLAIFTLWFFRSAIEPTYPSTCAAATKAGLSGLRAGISPCCARSSTNQLQTTAGSDICNPVIGTMLPEYRALRLHDAADLSYAITAQCDTDTPTMTATIKNHRKQACNGVWTITEKEITIPPGC